MPSILGIDTASPRGSVALLVDGAFGGRAEFPPGGHSSGLAPAAARLAEEAGIPLASLGGLAVARGPGSFTGLRIGLAYAKGLAAGAGIPLALVSSHEAAAHAASASSGGALLATVTPGERKEVEVALWEPAAPPDAGSRPRLLHGPESVPEADAADRLAALAAGRDYRAVPANDAIAALLDEDEIPRAEVALLATSVAALGALLLARGEIADLWTAAPAYGRAPNARKPSS